MLTIRDHVVDNNDCRHSRQIRRHQARIVNDYTDIVSTMSTAARTREFLREINSACSQRAQGGFLLPYKGQKSLEVNGIPRQRRFLGLEFFFSQFGNKIVSAPGDSLEPDPSLQCPALQRFH